MLQLLPENLFFDARIRQVPPGFTPVKGEKIPPGCRLYRLRLGSLTAFVLLLLVAKSRGFTFEARWSRDGRYPFYEIPVSVDEADPELGAIRAGEFLGKGDHWWLIKQAGDRGVHKAVDEAISLIEEQVIDFLTDISHRRRAAAGQYPKPSTQT